jgi:hypothetical protein
MIYLLRLEPLYLHTNADVRIFFGIRPIGMLPLKDFSASTEYICISPYPEWNNLGKRKRNKMCRLTDGRNQG